MKSRTQSKNGTQTEITLTLPSELLEDLTRIALFNKTKLESTIYSYIVDGLASDSCTVRRLELTGNGNKVPGKSNSLPETVEKIFNDLIL